MRAPLAVLLAVGLAAVEARAETSVEFICPDGTRYTLLTQESGAALLKGQAGDLRLRDRHSSLGLSYGSDEGEVQMRPDGSATLRLGGQSPRTCRRIGQ